MKLTPVTKVYQIPSVLVHLEERTKLTNHSDNAMLGKQLPDCECRGRNSLLHDIFFRGSSRAQRTLKTGVQDGQTDRHQGGSSWHLPCLPWPQGDALGSLWSAPCRPELQVSETGRGKGKQGQAGARGRLSFRLLWQDALASKVGGARETRVLVCFRGSRSPATAHASHVSRHAQDPSVLQSSRWGLLFRCLDLTYKCLW